MPSATAHPYPARIDAPGPAVRYAPFSMPNLPSGTVTFVFSDVEGSTALLKRLAGMEPEANPDGGAVGLHTGEPAVGDEGYTGLDVVRASRIAATGRADRSCCRTPRGRSSRAICPTASRCGRWESGGCATWTGRSPSPSSSFPVSR